MFFVYVFYKPWKSAREILTFGSVINHTVREKNYCLKSRQLPSIGNIVTVFKQKLFRIEQLLPFAHSVIIVRYLPRIIKT